MARNEVIHVAVRGDVKANLQRIADNYGMTMSALASYVIGQWVYNQLRIVEPMLDEMAKVGVKASEAMRQER